MSMLQAAARSSSASYNCREFGVELLAFLQFTCRASGCPYLIVLVQLFQVAVVNACSGSDHQ